MASSRPADEPAALRAWAWRSEHVLAAELAPDGTTLDVNDALAVVSRRSPVGGPFADLVSAPQRPALAQALAGCGEDGWTTLTLGFHDGGAGIAEDRVVSLRRAGDRVVVLAEPARGEHDRLVGQVLDLNDDLIEAQRDLGRRQRELERARAAAEHANQRLRGLEAMTLAGLTSADLDEGLGLLLASAHEILATERASVLLVDEEADRLAVRAHAGAEVGVAPPGGVRLGEGLAGAAAATGRTAVDGAVAAVPLRLESGVIGVLEVAAAGGRPLAREDVAAIELVAERAALAVGHAQLRDRERRLVETLQRSLLPERLPAPPGVELAWRYVPRARTVHVGGDFYEAAIRPDGALAFALGDVAGKGLRAASTMGELRSALHAYVIDGHEPGETLLRLDHLMSVRQAMATAVCMVLEPGTGELRYASAGHVPALHLRAGGAPPEELGDGRSPPLGFGPIDRPQATATVAPGDRLLLYTDGLIELGHDLSSGFASLRAAAASGPHDLEALCDHMLATIASGRRYEDDVALLAVRLSAAD
jgi:serine phosphatase RsbU (regulator of sigma subunit)